MTYLELQQELKNRIRSGELTGKLPSIAMLTQHYQVSHGTIKKVLDRLKLQSYLYGHQGKGLFVNEEMRERELCGSVAVFINIHSLHNPFYLRFLRHAKELLDVSGIKMDTITDYRDEPIESYDAIILVNQVLPDETVEIFRRRVGDDKLIFLHDYKEKYSTIGTDNAAGSLMLLEHLYVNGHRNIGVLTRDLHLPGNFFHQRYKGVTEFAGRHGDVRIFSENLTPGDVSGDEMRAEEVTGLLMRQSEKITAVYAFTDTLALGVYAYLQKHNLRIPADISVVSFDNRDFSPLLNPPLTTVEESANEIAACVVKRVKKMISGNAKERIEIFVQPKLIIRSSILDVN